VIGQILARTSPKVIHDKVVNFYHRFITSAVVPSPTALIDLLSSLREATSRVLLVLDDPGQSYELLAPLLDVVSKAADLTLLVTSSNRFLESQDDCITIDIEALSSPDHRKGSFNRAMCSRIAEIQRKIPDDDQRQSALIDEAFERILSHAFRDSGHEDLAMAAFDVVLHAFSPLREHQFKTAVRHVLRCRRPHPITYPTITDVIEATGGLLFVQQDSVINWFHNSLFGYFERSHARWFPSGHASMAWACLTVLMSQAIPTDAGGTGNWATGSLYGYAACSWGQHLRACLPNLVLEDMAMTYLEDQEKLKLGCLTAYTLQPGYVAYGFDTHDVPTPAHVCSIFGLTALLQRLPTADLHRQAPSTGRTPLAYACKMEHLDTVQFLLDSGADPGLEDVDGLDVNASVGFALKLASKQGRIKVVQLLLDGGADVNADYSTAKDPGETPFMRLISTLEMEHTDTVKPGRTPLSYACRFGHVDTVALLLKAGADPMLGHGARFDDTHAVGSSVLHQAIQSRNLPVVEMLLRFPSVSLTPTISSEHGIVSVLTSLFQLRSLAIVRLALARGDLDINEKDHNGRTAIWWLLRADEEDPEFQLGAMQLVVQHPKCYINAADLGGRTYIMRFIDVRIPNIKLLSLLLENGAEVNAMDYDGETAISHAVTARYSLEITSLLIRHGADLATRNVWGQGLSHRLVADVEDLEDLQYLDLLLEHMPALIDAQDDRGRTPLHLALVFGKTEMARELLARAANVSVLDKFGRAPFDVACQYGRTAILPRLAPVGIYKLDPSMEAEQPSVVSQARQSVPLRLQRLGRPPTLPLRSIRRAQSELGLYANARQASTEVPEPWNSNQDRLRPKDEAYNTFTSNAFTSIFQPPQIVREVKSRGDRHGTQTNILAAGEAMLEMQLERLPGWSLGYLGKCQPVDISSSTDICRTI
jgi:ankyrin repeat protein